MKWLTSLLGILLLTTLLSGCETGDSRTIAVLVCPTIRQYPQPFLDQALGEYQALPSDSAIKRMIGDYHTLRNQVRACRKKNEQ